MSLLIHVIASVLFLLPRQGVFNGTTVTFLDLNMSMASKPGQAASPINSAKPAAAAKEEAPASPPPADVTPLTELEKLQKNIQETLDTAASQPAAVQQVSLGLGMASGYFSSIAEGETLRGDIREYYFEVLRCINEKWWVSKDRNLTGGRKALFYLVIARNGTIVDKRLVVSSGNPAYDKAMLQTLEAANPLPPLPETFRGDFFQAPLRFNVPLNLLESLKIG